MAFSVNDAISIGMIQKLINTEVSAEWVEQVGKDELGPNVDERTLSFIELQIMGNLNGHAITLANNLEDEDNRALWVQAVKENTDRISVLRKENLVKYESSAHETPKWIDDMN